MAPLKSGIQPRNCKMANLSDLTHRELEILQLILAGYTNQAIANEISISRKTVEFHLGHIYTKIGVRTRMMAGIWAFQHGLRINSQLEQSSAIPGKIHVVMDAADVSSASN